MTRFELRIEPAHILSKEASAINSAASRNPELRDVLSESPNKRPIKVIFAYDPPKITYEREQTARTMLSEMKIRASNSHRRICLSNACILFSIQ